ncbi:Geranylgeranyl pyrophosphate synthase [Orbilia ellipsospora]|uniref:Geranylgeranyl pyrophosphate synthase n=1 Tax=Orbilia ellipsospora TaxID=2528407 RepID=A0AAV9WT82_9PEZI
MAQIQLMLARLGQNLIFYLSRARMPVVSAAHLRVSMIVANTDLGTAKEDYLDKEQCNSPDSVQLQLGLPPWLSSYPRLPEETVLEPFKYVASLPSKRIREVAIKALDIWYQVPEPSLNIIISAIDMLHSSSLMVKIRV